MSQRALRPATRVFVWGTVVVALLLIALSLPHLPPADPATVAVCILLSVVLERFYVSQAGGSAISPSLAAIFGAMWLTGPVGGLCCAVLAAAASSIFRRKLDPERILLNAAAVSLAVLAAGAVGADLGLHPRQTLDYASLLAAFVALLVYFAVNTFAVGAVIAIDARGSLAATWRQHFLWLAPQYLAMGLVGTVGAAAYLALGVPGLLGYLVPLLAVYYTLRLYTRRADEDLRAVRALNARLETTNDQLIEALAAIVDARDSLLYGHSAQVALYAVKIGEEMGLGPEELEMLRKAALLHDVGKVAVPEELLFKPDALTPAEYAMIQHHAIVGEQLVGLVDALRPLAVLVGQHHEAWDGTGYPRGLAGEEIALAARIINLCDALDTILSDRPYKRGRPLEWAVAEVNRCRGTQFDPAVVDAFMRVLEREGAGLFVNSAHATAVGPRRSELFGVLRELGLNVRSPVPGEKTQAS